LAAKTAAGCRGKPSKSVTIRLRLGNILISNRRSRDFVGPVTVVSNVSPARAGGGYLVAVSWAVNRSFSGPSADPRKLRIFELRPRFDGEESELSKPSAARLPTSRPGSDFRRCFKNLRSRSAFVFGPVPSGGGYLVADLRDVNRPFSGFWPIPGSSGSSGQTWLRRRWEARLPAPSRRGGRRLETRQLR
jgi:hypothetical protein